MFARRGIVAQLGNLVGHVDTPVGHWRCRIKSRRFLETAERLKPPEIVQQGHALIKKALGFFVVGADLEMAVANPVHQRRFGQRVNVFQRRGRFFRHGRGAGYQDTAD